MSLQCEKQNGVSVITINDEFDSDTAAEVRTVLSAKTTLPNIVVDLAPCRFIASIGLEALLEILRACESRGGRMLLAGLDDNCRKILQVTRLDLRFECHEDVATALRLV